MVESAPAPDPVVSEPPVVKGKDGLIRKVGGAFDPQGVRVTSFGVPTEVELRHDYLWRVHAATPGKGYIGIFNRSHYEDVLVVRVNQLVPDAVWRERYGQINAFEDVLAASGTRIVKLYLHISRDEQKRRFLERLDRPEKNWKFSASDLAERGHWDEYMAAYEDAIGATSTEWAPWHVVPADYKWVTRAVVADIVTSAIRGLDLKYPEVTAAQKKLLDEARTKLSKE